MRRNNIMNEVVVAVDGETALKHLHGDEGATERPALILLDLRLPGLSGFDVLQKIREHPKTRLIPIVVLTANRDPDAVVKAYEAGANSYLVKPTDPVEYSEVVLQIGMYWLLLNEVAGQKTRA